MKKKVTLEVHDTGNATANLILLMNAWMRYARDDARLSNRGITRVVELFKDDSVMDVT